jgi:hypothetical protein
MYRSYTQTLSLILRYIPSLQCSKTTSRDARPRASQRSGYEKSIARYAIFVRIMDICYAAMGAVELYILVARVSKMYLRIPGIAKYAGKKRLIGFLEELDLVKNFRYFNYLYFYQPSLSFSLSSVSRGPHSSATCCSFTLLIPQP